MSLLYDALLHYDIITLHYDVIILLHYDVMTSLHWDIITMTWLCCHNIMTMFTV